MSDLSNARQSWGRIASICGLAGVLCYFMAAFLPLPDAVTRLLAFAFGPLLSASFFGIYRFMAMERDSATLQLACLFGVIAGVLVTTMLVVQVGNNMVRAEALAEASGQELSEAARTAWRAVNRVQYLVDVVWDIFICAAVMLLGGAMLRHPGFGPFFGWPGIAAAFALLVLNLWTFPTAPAYAGSVDLGPLVALWMMAVFIRTIQLAGRT